MSVFSGVGKEGSAWGRAGVLLSPPGGVRALKATPGLTLGPLSALSQPRPFIWETQPPHLAVTLAPGRTGLLICRSEVQN